MRVVFSFVLLLPLFACDAQSSGKRTRETPSRSPEGQLVPKETASINPIVGSWRSAKDPRGEVAATPMYEGATLEFTAEGAYRFSLPGLPKPLEGMASVTSRQRNVLVVDVDMGKQRSTQYTITMRDASHMVVKEGKAASVFYAKR